MNPTRISAEMLLKENPELKGSSVLLALSGGVDSMVLAELLLEADVNVSAAHCNFNLRGSDSDKDETFVKEFCTKNRIPLFVRKFDTLEFKKTGNYSTQMAARKLRYDWFEELMKEGNFDFLLTAHHLDDDVETFLINLSRGTGLKGLSGMKRKSGSLLRPLLFASKEDILQYAEHKKLDWQEDSSNLEDSYIRNKIRLHILPVLKELHPQFLNNFRTTTRNLKDTDLFLEQYKSIWKARIFHRKGDRIHISIPDLCEEASSAAALYFLFEEFGFSTPEELKKLIDSRKDAEIRSADYRLIKNREELILAPLSRKQTPEEIELGEEGFIQKPVYLKVLKADRIDGEPTEVLDARDIVFPLKIRKKRSGDRFTPLGMSGRKKLSKFFKDEKFSKLEKEAAWLLIDNDDKILYVLGSRIDDNFKVKDNTHEFLNIYLC